MGSIFINCIHCFVPVAINEVKELNKNKDIAVAQMQQAKPHFKIVNGKQYQYGFKNGYYGYHDNTNAFFQVDYESGITTWFKMFNNQVFPHRADGPSTVYTDGYTEYWQNGRRLTQNQVKQMKAQGY